MESPATAARELDVNPYRPNPKAGPVKCSECVFGLESPRKDCLMVDDGARFRSLTVTARRWRADSAVGCDDFFPLADLDQVEAFARARGNQRAVDEFVDIRRRRGLGA